jgi:hypothetical protein
MLRLQAGGELVREPEFRRFAQVCISYIKSIPRNSF